MPKPTDDEVGALLRETFADKEKLVDQLPKATVPPVRRRAPALLAAAATIAVLAGATGLAGDTGRQVIPGSNGDQAGPTTPTQRLTEQSHPASAVLPPRPRLTALAIAEIAKWEQPSGGWPVVKVLDAPYGGAGSPAGPGVAGAAFTVPERSQIAASAGVPIEWVKDRPTGSRACDHSGVMPYVTVGQLVFDKSNTSATVGMSMWRGCLGAQWLTYRLARDSVAESDASWRITGTVGPVAMS